MHVSLTAALALVAALVACLVTTGCSRADDAPVRCRTQTSGGAHDRECAIVYAIDSAGRFRQIREYRDPRAAFAAPPIVLGPGGWIYGASSVVGTRASGVRPALFRVSVSGARFEIVHRFADRERVLGIGPFAIDAHGVAYAFANVNVTGDRADAAFVRIAAGRAKVVARFGNVEPVAAPRIAPDGTITAVIADRATCVGTYVFFRPIAHAPGTFTSGEWRIRRGCRPPHAARSARTSRDGTYALYARRLERTSPSGTRTLEAELPASFGYFAGSPLVARPHETYAFAAGSNGGVCMRLVRVAGGGVDVVHTFRHEDGWCLPRSIRFSAMERK